jgi:hypothetical protein
MHKQDLHAPLRVSAQRKKANRILPPVLCRSDISLPPTITSTLSHIHG